MHLTSRPPDPRSVYHILYNLSDDESDTSAEDSNASDADSVSSDAGRIASDADTPGWGLAVYSSADINKNINEAIRHYQHVFFNQGKN